MFSGFLFISTQISLDLLSLGSAKAYIGWGGKLNGRLMASCVRNIRSKNYQNLTIGFQITVKNVGDAFLGHSVVALRRLFATMYWSPKLSKLPATIKKLKNRCQLAAFVVKVKVQYITVLMRVGLDKKRFTVWKWQVINMT